MDRKYTNPSLVGGIGIHIYLPASAMDIKLFENTEIAFSGKSNKELRRASLMFKLVGEPALVRLGKILTWLAIKLHIPFAWAIRNNLFAQFCGGESITECAEATKILDRHNVGTILDYSVEGKQSEDDFSRTFEEIMETIRTANKNDHIPFCVFKVTGMGRFSLLEKVNKGEPLSEVESQEFTLLKTRVNTICQLADEAQTPVFIDAEESWIQDTIDRLATEMMAKFNRETVSVFNTIQLYRHDRLDFLRKSHEAAQVGGYKLGLKLVRGAYMEKERLRASDLGYPSPIQRDKASSDQDFDLALKHCVENVNEISLCCGTHNEVSCSYLIDLMKDFRVSPSDKRICFAQLFGMSDQISFNLSALGYNVAKYVPYGPIKEVIPYLIRRAEENTSVKGQTGRELRLIQTERKRRESQRKAEKTNH